MAVIKCKMCGGNLEITGGMTVAECEYCGSTQTVPSIDSEKKIKLFERANKLRSACEFDKAYGVYESIVAEYEEEAEAYWGLLLCKYGIEYVDDPKDGRKVPTCHRSSYDSVMDDENLELAMENTDAIARQVYREEAKQIEELRKRIIEVSMKEEPYDIFICYKETDENGERTLDSVLAQDVYSALIEKGYRVFFSRITLEEKLGVEYEPYIFAALNSAKVMLAFGTKYEYYHAVWVKNEWNRFLQIMESDHEKHLIPCYKDIDAYDIPKEFTKLQAQDLGKVGAIQDLVRGIDKLMGKKEEVKKRGKFEYTIQNKIDNLLKRGFEELTDGNWEEAKNKFEDVLTIDGEHTKAYIGLFMVKHKLKEESNIYEKGKEMLKERGIDIYEKEQYIKKAYQYADSEYKKVMDKWKLDIGLNVKYEDAVEKFQKKKVEREQVEEDKTEIVEMEKLGKLINNFVNLSEEFEKLGNFKDSKILVEECKQQCNRVELFEKYQRDVDSFVENAEKIPEVKKNFDEVETIYQKMQMLRFYDGEWSFQIGFSALFALVAQAIYLMPFFTFTESWHSGVWFFLGIIPAALWCRYIDNVYITSDMCMSDIVWVVMCVLYLVLHIIEENIKTIYLKREIVIFIIPLDVSISKKLLSILEYFMQYGWLLFIGLAIIYFIKEILRINKNNKTLNLKRILKDNVENIAKDIKIIWCKEYKKIYEKYMELGTVRKNEKEVLAGNYQKLDNYINKIKKS